MVSAPNIIDQSLLSHAVVLFEAMADINDEARDVHAVAITKAIH